METSMNTDPPKKIGIILVGFGTVGHGVIEQLHSAFQSQPTNIELIAIIDRGSKIDERKNEENFLNGFFSETKIEWLDDRKCSDILNAIIKDEEIYIVIECTGSLSEDIKLLYEECLNRGIPVVTPNKGFLVNNLELIDKFFEKGVPLMFEAAVGGGMPVIKLLRDNFANDKIRFVAGILNGTTNYILSLLRANEEFDVALEKARRRGLAEKPMNNNYIKQDDADLNGKDIYYKLILLSRLIWNIKPEEINHNNFGISLHDVRLCDIRYAIEKLNREIKFIGIIRQLRSGDDSYDLFFTPVLLSNDHGFANVKAETNILLISSDFAGTTISLGPGAGSSPTANAIMSDVGVLINEMVTHSFQKKLCAGSVLKKTNSVVKFRNISELEFPGYYVRFVVKDSIGIVKKISECLSKFELDIKEVLQLEHSRDELEEVISLHENSGNISGYLIFGITLGMQKVERVKQSLAEIYNTFSIGQKTTTEGTFLLGEPLLIPFIDIPPIIGNQKWGNIKSLTEKAAKAIQDLVKGNVKFSVDLFPERYLDSAKYPNSQALLGNEVNVIKRSVNVRRILVFNQSTDKAILKKVIDLHRDKSIDVRYFNANDEALVNEIRRWEDGLLEDFVVFPTDELVIVELAAIKNNEIISLDSGYERYGSEHITPYVRKFEKLWDYAQEPWDLL